MPFRRSGKLSVPQYLLVSPGIDLSVSSSRGPKAARVRELARSRVYHFSSHAGRADIWGNEKHQIQGTGYITRGCCPQRWICRISGSLQGLSYTPALTLVLLSKIQHRMIQNSWKSGIKILGNRMLHLSQKILNDLLPDRHFRVFHHGPSSGSLLKDWSNLLPFSAYPTLTYVPCSHIHLV